MDKVLLEKLVNEYRIDYSEELLSKIFHIFKGYIYSLSRSYESTYFHIDDLVNICNYALYQACKKYNLGSNTFKYYAKTTIKNNLFYYLRSNKKFTNEVSTLDDYFTAMIDDNINLEEEFINESVSKEIKNQIKTLNELEQNIVYLHYYEGYSLKDVSKALGVNYQKILRVNKVLINKLRYKIKV